MANLPRRSNATEVNRSIFFSAAIIIAGFVPLFTLSGIEGHIFGPMARTYAYAICGGIIATFTVSPALSALLLPEHVSHLETFVVRAFRRRSSPGVRWGLSSSRNWRRAISGFEPPYPRQSRSKRGLVMPTGFGKWSMAFQRWSLLHRNSVGQTMVLTPRVSSILNSMCH
ncbi:MAG: efflux RND transporter permease subunit [Acetobacteraceae bacterium]|nr:efflux RND transporter permease subunit [Acetobacteraceae bacterium]